MKRRVARGAAHLVIGTGVAKCLGAVTSIALARILGAEGFGEFGIIQSTVLMFSTYAGLRLGSTAVKYVAEFRKGDPKRAAAILRLALGAAAVTCLIAAAAVFVFAPVIAEGTLRRPDLANSIRIGSLYLMFLTYGSVVQQSLSGFEDFRANSLNGILRSVLAAALCLPMAWAMGVTGALWGLVGSALLVIPQALALLSRQARRHEFPKSIAWNEMRGELSVLYSFALPGFLTIVLISGTSWLSRVLLTRASGFAELGIFEAAAQWTTVLFLAPTVIARVVLPILAAASAETSRSEFNEAFSLQLKTVLLVTTPVTVGMIGCVPVLVSAYGKEYAGASAVMPILLAAGLVRTVTESLRVVIESKGRQWYGLLGYVVSSLVFVAGAVLLIPRYSGAGLAIATMASQFVLLAMSGYQIVKHIAPGVIGRHLRLIAGMSLAAGVAMFGRCAMTGMPAYAVCAVAAVGSLIPIVPVVRGALLRGRGGLSLGRWGRAA